YRASRCHGHAITRDRRSRRSTGSAAMGDSMDRGWDSGITAGSCIVTCLPYHKWLDRGVGCAPTKPATMRSGVGLRFRRLWSLPAMLNGDFVTLFRIFDYLNEAIRALTDSPISPTEEKQANKEALEQVIPAMEEPCARWDLRASLDRLARLRLIFQENP